MFWMVCAVGLAVAALFALPSAAKADPAYGVSVTGPPAPKDLSQMGGGGVRYLRLPIAWNEVKTDAGGFDWRRTDAAVASATNNDIEVVPYLTGVPDWMRACEKKKCGEVTAPPAETDSWLRFVTAAVERYGPDGDFTEPVETWQVWDEANPTERGVVNSPRGYAVLLDATYRAIKLADPNAHVVSGAISFTQRAKRSMAPEKFLRQMLHSTKPRYSFSGLGVAPEAGSVGRLKAQLKSVRKILDASGQGDRGIWVTPIGWASDRRSSKTMSVGPAGQKKRLKQSLALVRDRFGIDGVFWSRWRDGSGGCGWCRYSGLLNKSGKPKPSWAAFKQFLKSVDEPVEPPPPPDPDASFFGVVPEQGAMTDSDLALMSAARVGIVRTIVNWQRVQPSGSGPYDWSSVDKDFEGLAMHGIQPMPQLFGDKDEVTQVNNQSVMDAWAAFVSATVRRYRPGGAFWTEFAAEHPGIDPLPPKIWQIYNEENICEFWPGGPYPNKYEVLLHRSAVAIRAADPAAKVMLGGMHGDDNMCGDLPSWKFLDGLYKDGAADDFDIVAVHPYAFSLDGIATEISTVRNVITANGDSATPIWVTEMGWSSELDPNTDQWWERDLQGQAEMLTAAWNLMLQNQEAWNLGGIFWYTWRDPTEDLCNFCNSAGLLEENYVPKPSFSAFSDLAHAGLPG